MKIELNKVQKLYVLHDILCDLLDEDVIDEFEFGKLLGSYKLIKGVSLGINDRKELGL